MSSNASRHTLLRFDLKLMLLLIVTVSIALMWWRTKDKLDQSESKLEAIRRAGELEAQESRVASTSVPRQVSASEITTPEEFVTALREIEDWYEFADDTADPFARTPAAEDAIPLLCDLLDDPDPEIRTRALASLGKIKRQPKTVVPAVIPMLQDEHANVRWHAAFAIGQFEDEARTAIPALTAQMNDDKSPVAAFSALMLQSIDDQVPTESRLIELLSNSSLENRNRAINGLVSVGTKSAMDGLVRQYRVEEDQHVREKLARAIAKIDAALVPRSTELDAPATSK